MDPIYLSPEQLISQDFQTVHQAYENYMLMKNHALATIKTYLCNFRKYNEWCTSRGITMMYDQDHVKAYLIYRVKNGAKWQTMNNIYSAMRKLFRDVLEIE